MKRVDQALVFRLVWLEESRPSQMHILLVNDDCSPELVPHSQSFDGYRKPHQSRRTVGSYVSIIAARRQPYELRRQAVSHATLTSANPM